MANRLNLPRLINSLLPAALEQLLELVFRL
jgi:hypothetical protein